MGCQAHMTNWLHSYKSTVIGPVLDTGQILTNQLKYWYLARWIILYWCTMSWVLANYAQNLLPEVSGGLHAQRLMLVHRGMYWLIVADVGKNKLLNNG